MNSNNTYKVVLKKMAEQRLIDVNDVYELIGQTGVAKIHVAEIDQIKRIAPETLPIVRQMREEMEKVTVVEIEGME